MYRVRSVQGEFIGRLLLLFVSETVEMLLMAGTRITLDNVGQGIDFRRDKKYLEGTPKNCVAETQREFVSTYVNLRPSPR